LKVHPRPSAVSSLGQITKYARPEHRSIDSRACFRTPSRVVSQAHDGRAKEK
jgi:hypothetical protein